MGCKSCCKSCWYALCCCCIWTRLCGWCPCCSKDDPEPLTFKPAKDRKCTDVLFCLLFIIFWLGMAIVAILGVANGEPLTLIYGSNYDGSTCGVDKYEDRKNTYYPRITEDILKFASSGKTNPLDIDLLGICVDDCPSSGEVICTASGETDLLAHPSNAGNTKSSRISTYDGCGESSNWNSNQCSNIRGNCWVVPLNSVKFFFRCLWQREKSQTEVQICTSPPTLAGYSMDELKSNGNDGACVTKYTTKITNTTGEAESNPMIEQFFTVTEAIGRTVNDGEATFPVILVCGGLVALIAGFLYLYLLRYCAGCIVWTTIIGVVIALLVCVLFAYNRAGILTQETVNSATDEFNEQTGQDVETTELPADLQKGDEELETRWKYFAYVLTVVLIILVLLIVFMRKKIKVAVAVIREASKAINDMKFIVFYPLVTVVSLVILVVYWIIIAAFVYSSGEITTEDVASAAADITGSEYLLCAENPDGSIDNTTCTVSIPSSNWHKNGLNGYLLLYHFFGLLWTVQWILAIGMLVIAGAIARWYFTADKKMPEDKRPVCASFHRAVRFHLGTAAFGALIIAIIQFVRAIMAYLDHKSKSLQEKNALIKFLFKCIHCCLWCFEKCVKFITKYAFIYVALKGNSFCSSARSALGLIISQAAQIAVVETISTFMLLLGKFLICSVAGFFAFQWIDNADTYQEGGDNELESYAVPMVLTLILAFGVSTGFLAVYGLAINTILLCFCEDMKRAGTAEQPYYMSEELAGIMGKDKKKLAKNIAVAEAEKPDEVKPVEPKVIEVETTGDEGLV